MKNNNNKNIVSKSLWFHRLASEHFYKSVYYMKRGKYVTYLPTCNVEDILPTYKTSISHIHTDTPGTQFFNLE